MSEVSLDVARERLLDQVFGVFARPSPANQNSLQLAEVWGEPAHHNNLTYCLLQSTLRQII